MTKKFIILSALVILAFLLNVWLGSVWIPKSVWSDLFHLRRVDAGYAQIINFRLAKAVTAFLVGTGLATGGLLMQSLFRNPIVGPYVLGLSSGAGLGVAILILGSSALGFTFVSDFGITLAASLGSVISLLLIISFYYKVKNTTNLLIIGLMMGIFSGAVVSILSYFTQAEKLQKYVFWSMGNLGNNSWTQIVILLIINILSFIIVLSMLKQMNALLLGENYARSMGVPVKRVNYIIIVVTGVLTGSITAFVGPIAFVGLAVPHLSKRIFKTQLLPVLFPAGILIGAALMLFCDTLAQVPGAIITLPINSITVLMGAPLVVYLIYKSK